MLHAVAGIVSPNVKLPMWRIVQYLRRGCREFKTTGMYFRYLEMTRCACFQLGRNYVSLDVGKGVSRLATSLYKKKISTVCVCVCVCMYV